MRFSSRLLLLLLLPTILLAPALRGLDRQSSADYHNRRVRLSGALNQGIAVVFAALTVIIALCGLSVVGIPFLTVMGLAAATAVAVVLGISGAQPAAPAARCSARPTSPSP